MTLLSLTAKISVVLGVDVATAARIASLHGTLEDLRLAQQQSHLPLALLLSWLLNPELIRDYRLNPNRMTLPQLQQLPGLNPDRLIIVQSGRPFFSIAEFAQASQLSLDVLRSLIELPDYCWFDKTRGQRVAVTPIQGVYSAIAQSPDFESVSTDALTNFEYRTRAIGNKRIAVIAPTLSPLTEAPPSQIAAASEAPGVPPSSLALPTVPAVPKHLFSGRICPALRDAEGIVRYIVPLSIDLWFEASVERDRIDAILTALNLQTAPDQTESLSRLGYIRAVIPGCPIDTDALRAATEIVRQTQYYSEIRFAEPEQIGLTDFVPDNAQIVEDTNVGATDFESTHQYWNHQAIHLLQAHQLTTGSPRVTVFVIDSGLETQHPSLSASLRSDWRNVDLNFSVGLSESDRSPEETAITHGTQVTSFIGGQNGISGIAPKCAVLPIKISGSLGYGLRAAAIHQAIALLPPGDRGIINISWRTQGDHIGIREALVAAAREGFAIVTSAGNYRPGEPQYADKVHYPSAYASREPYISALCSVAATTVDNRRADYSYFGLNSVTVAAPGGEPGRSGIALYAATPVSQYAYVWGTSFAAPHVTGLLALMFSLNHHLTAEAAIERLKQTAQPLLSPINQSLGRGLVNARAALQSVLPATAPISNIQNHPPKDPRFEPSHPLAVPSATNAAKINLNTATAEQLSTLPGMNAWRIEQLTKYRQTDGPLTSIWDLLKTNAFNFWIIYQLAEQVEVP